MWFIILKDLFGQETFLTSPHPSVHIQPILSIHYKIPLRDVIKNNLQMLYEFSEFRNESLVFCGFTVHEKVRFIDSETDFA